jgi:hypothetical protein
MTFERIGSETVWKGQIATVHVDRIRYDDGDEADRERVSHPGAVAVVAHDGERLFLVRQPREAVEEPDLLELPASSTRSATSTSPPTCSTRRRKPTRTSASRSSDSRWPTWTPS